MVQCADMVGGSQVSDLPVVHVTQGGLDNVDLSKVTEPTIAELVDKDLLL